MDEFDDNTEVFLVLFFHFSIEMVGSVPKMLKSRKFCE